jgi:hypothetical protein
MLEVVSVAHRPRFGYRQRPIHVSLVVARWWRFSWAGPRWQIGLRRPGKSNVYIYVFLLSQVDSNKQCFHNPVYAYLSAARNSIHPITLGLRTVLLESESESIVGGSEMV